MHHHAWPSSTFLYLSSNLSHACVFMGVGPSPRVCSLRKTDSLTLPHIQQPLVPSGSSARGGLHEALPIHAGMLPGSILCESCACSRSHCEFTCTTPLTSPVNTVSLQKSTTSGSCSLSLHSSTIIPEPSGKRV